MAARITTQLQAEVVRELKKDLEASYSEIAERCTQEVSKGHVGKIALDHNLQRGGTPAAAVSPVVYDTTRTHSELDNQDNIVQTNEHTEGTPSVNVDALEGIPTSYDIGDDELLEELEEIASVASETALDMISWYNHKQCNCAKGTDVCGYHVIGAKEYGVTWYETLAEYCLGHVDFSDTPEDGMTEKKRLEELEDYRSSVYYEALRKALIVGVNGSNSIEVDSKYHIENWFDIETWVKQRMSNLDSDDLRALLWEDKNISERPARSFEKTYEMFEERVQKLANDLFENDKSELYEHEHSFMVHHPDDYEDDYEDKTGSRLTEAQRAEIAYYHDIALKDIAFYLAAKSLFSGDTKKRLAAGNTLYNEDKLREWCDETAYDWAENSMYPKPPEAGMIDFLGF